ncbi:ATP synthase CF0 subunit I chloroplast [Cinnamomum micranthum f. kanehirae]|uniref:ATP synthase CF0 subunit I chloroplast n=1 Tax=Cinnamomum micranthum f. kanehirae TaxID=337451 RepID=A0A443Q5F6_9MAGN|nr:ATP synthase CF0 subunit I chloroplast [Cinnamomum micranthum f. kanehirae]
MRDVTDSFVSFGHWPSAGSFGFNTDILATNLINLSVVLDNRKQRILSTIRNSEELREGAIEQLEEARARLRKVEIEADEFRNLERLENYKNETIHFEQQRAINQVRQRVFQQALQGALGTLNSCSNSELHLRTIGANIGMLGAMKEVTD